MTFQWGTPGAINYGTGNFNVTAEKVIDNETAYLFLASDLDGFQLSDQQKADVAGLIKDALEGDGWSVAVYQPGTVGRPLEEVPEPE